jgi:ribulose-5-phosphate 4-epimerase/fuculose-1-phosphate aldolase
MKEKRSMSVQNARTENLMQARTELELRVETAAIYRLLAHFGMDDLINSHTSCRLPGNPLRYLIKDHALTFDETTASNLVVLDVEGNVVQGSAGVAGPIGYVIHSAIQSARDDARCVIHTHTHPGMAVAAMKCGLLSLNQISMMFHGRVAYFEYEEFASTSSPGESAETLFQKRLASALGGMNCMILRSHGLITVGRTPAQAFYRMYYLEQACRIQMNVMQSKTEHVLPSDAIAESVAVYEESDPRPLEQVNFDALVRRLDRIDPSFRR